MPEKYQDEIEEILRRSGESTPVKSPVERQKPLDDSPETYNSMRDLEQSNVRSPSWLPSISPGKVMLGGLIIFVVAALLGFSPLIWLGLAILVGAYLLFFVKPGSSRLEKRWRGRTVEEDDGSNVDKLKKWLRR
ncbi:MAG: hypothetical protein BZY88_06955 [SAR202 cluster bacterium Io17-Chloro-G9]|nr:MAG: hypothetical protein BZY88_06955 [SAR202 cluster bacterium Io17-Chloro-G9]